MATTWGEAARYATLEKAGEGAFGAVFRARDWWNGAEVALKRVRVDVRQMPTNALHELNTLGQLSGVSPHVMPLHGAHTHGANMVLVMPFVSCSLATVLAGRNLPLAEAHIACLGQMLLSGLSAIHAEGLVHRDIKPANLLLDRLGTLLIADFGQARLIPRRQDVSLSHAVATRWYRAPELLLGARRYGAGVDIWACGCVLAQLFTISPLLPGDCDIGQLLRVIEFLGSPTEATWPVRHARVENACVGRTQLGVHY